MVGLVKGSNAVRWNEQMGTKTGRNAYIGNADSFSDVRVKNALTAAHSAMNNGIQTVEALTRDESRTEPQRHQRAKAEAEKVSTALKDVHDKMMAVADEDDAVATSMLNDFLNINDVNGFLLAKKFEYIQSQWKNGDGGAQRIREAVNADPHIAAIMYNSASYLLGIPEDSRMTYLETGIKAHVPKAEAKIESAKKLRDAAGKIPDAITNTHSSFYSSPIAAKMSTRVE